MANEKPKIGTKFSMTKEEQANLSGRNFLLSKLEYLFQMLNQAISTDMAMFVDQEIKKRVGLASETLVDVNIADGTLTITDPEQKETTTTGKKVAEA